MHEIEPFHGWLHLYNSEEDVQSPFYDIEHSEFEYSNKVYNYYLHPQWDSFGSATLYLRVLYADYELQFAIIEFIGEWNDAIENDIMQLKRGVIDVLIAEGISQFILIGENIMNFHGDEVDYYEEWSEDIEENLGWITFLNLPEHIKQEMRTEQIGRYCFFMDFEAWRVHLPEHLFQWVESGINRLLS